MVDFISRIGRNERVLEAFFSIVRAAYHPPIIVSLLIDKLTDEDQALTRPTNVSLNSNPESAVKYRKGDLTSVLCKIFEKLLKKTIFHRNNMTSFYVPVWGASFTSSEHCTGAANTERRLVFMIHRSFPD